MQHVTVVLSPHKRSFLPSSFLDDVSSAGEHAQEFLELLRKLTEDPKWKSYLAMRGVLPKIGTLIDKVCLCVCVHAYMRACMCYGGNGENMSAFSISSISLPLLRFCIANIISSSSFHRR